MPTAGTPHARAKKKRLIDEEHQIRTTKNNRNKRNNKLEIEQKEKNLGEIWTTNRWITDYIQVNNEKWDIELKKLQENEFKQLELRDKLTRKQILQTITNNKKKRLRTENNLT